MFTASSQIGHLDIELRPPSGLSGHGRVSAEMAAFAGQRYRVAPVLQHALSKSVGEAGAGSRRQLDRPARLNAERIVRQHAAARTVLRVLRRV